MAGARLRSRKPRTEGQESWPQGGPGFGTSGRNTVAAGSVERTLQHSKCGAALRVTRTAVEIEERPADPSKAGVV